MKEIKVGQRGSMPYVLEILKSKDTEIVIKARSKLIVKAIDIVMMYKKHFGNITIKNVIIDSEEKKDKYGNVVTLSKINILVQK